MPPTYSIDETRDGDDYAAAAFCEIAGCEWRGPWHYTGSDDDSWHAADADGRAHLEDEH